MKLWNELTEEEQKAVIKLAEDLYKIFDEAIIEPLTALFDDLSWFFMAAEGIIKEDQFRKAKEGDICPKCKGTYIQKSEDGNSYCPDCHETED